MNDTIASEKDKNIQFNSLENTKLWLLLNIVIVNTIDGYFT